MGSDQSLSLGFLPLAPLAIMPDNRHRLPPLRFALGDYLPPPAPLPPAPATFSFTTPFAYYPASPPYAISVGFNTERRLSLCSKHAHAHRRASLAPYPSPISPEQLLPPLPHLPLHPCATVRRPSLPSLTKPCVRPRASTGPSFSVSSSAGSKMSCYSCRKSKKRCDEVRPCERCAKRGWECTMEGDDRGKRRSGTFSSQESDRRSSSEASSTVSEAPKAFIALRRLTLAPFLSRTAQALSRRLRRARLAVRTRLLITPLTPSFNVQVQNTI